MGKVNMPAESYLLVLIIGKAINTASGSRGRPTPQTHYSTSAYSPTKTIS